MIIKVLITIKTIKTNSSSIINTYEFILVVFLVIIYYLLSS